MAELQDRASGPQRSDRGAEIDSPDRTAPPRTEALRDLQARLATRLDAAQGQQPGRSWLAVECAGAGLLLRLSEAGEIFPFRGSVAVPHTRPWFLGVTDLRGSLHGVVDLGRFLGLAGSKDGPPASGWLVALNPQLESSSALRVDRLAGLRREDQLEPVGATEPEGGAPRPGFAGRVFREPAAAARAWQEISLAELATDRHFLGIAAPP